MNYSISWVKLEKYAELTGDSVDVAKHRIKSGKWLHGDQIKIVDGRLWVNLRAVERWAEEWGTPGALARSAEAASGKTTTKKRTDREESAP
jgi:hypothetical protein